MIALEYPEFQNRTVLGRATISVRLHGSATGNAILASTPIDPFGNERSVLQHVVTLETGRIASVDDLDFSPLLALLDAHGIDTFYLDATSISLSQRAKLSSILDADTRWEADDWPCLPDPRLADNRPIARLVRARAPPQRTLASFDQNDDTRAGISFDAHTRDLISRLQSAIEEIAAKVTSTGPGRLLGATRIMTVGSTSRGTYTSLPVDFDLVILTERDQEHLDHVCARLVCGAIGDAVEHTPAFEAYWRAIAASGAATVDAAPHVVLDWFGVRGKQSLVGRLDAVMQNSPVQRRIPFLDITFGKLSQLVGYEVWMQRTFGRLGPVAADRLRSEIRLAKCTLKQVGMIYGSANHGLRAHAVEQLVIQSHNYRASGGVVGTFENSMRLITEEGRSRSDSIAVPFETFSKAFPLWHPGWWESAAGLVPFEHNVDLWNFLGDGEPVAAAERWLDLVDFAQGFCERLSSSR